MEGFELARAGARDKSEAATARGFKCARCGHMIESEAAEATCDGCGFHCTLQVCSVVFESHEGY